jgi:hypothetical protein
VKLRSGFARQLRHDGESKGTCESIGHRAAQPQDTIAVHRHYFVVGTGNAFESSVSSLISS